MFLHVLIFVKIEMSWSFIILFMIGCLCKPCNRGSKKKNIQDLIIQEVMGGITLTQGQYMLIVFLHDILVEGSFVHIQQCPLLLREMHGHLLKRDLLEIGNIF